MNFQAYLEDTYRIIKEEPLILILGGLVVQLLTIFSLGLLSGPLVGGYMLLVILYFRENQKPSFNDIFAGLQQFARLFPYFLVLLLIFFGFLMLILPGMLLATWWLYVLPLMVDRNMPFTDAMRLSMNTVNEKGFLMHLIFMLLITVIPVAIIELISAVIPFAQLLKILLPPFQVGCLASLYIDQFGIEEVSPDPAADEKPVDETVEIQKAGNDTSREDDKNQSAGEEGTVANDEASHEVPHEEKTKNSSVESVKTKPEDEEKL